MRTVDEWVASELLNCKVDVNGRAMSIELGQEAGGVTAGDIISNVGSLCTITGERTETLSVTLTARSARG